MISQKSEATIDVTIDAYAEMNRGGVRTSGEGPFMKKKEDCNLHTVNN